MASFEQKANSNDFEKQHKKNRWQLLRNVIRAIYLFKTQEAKQTELSEIINQIKKIPTDKVYRLQQLRSRENSPYVVAIKDLRREQSLQQCVERGNSDDLNQIKIEIDSDPYKLLRNPNHPLALINKRNKDGQTPLYVACKNGNLEVVLLLLDEGADYLINSVIGTEEESNLEVAARWSHKKIIEELMKKKWPKSVVQKAKDASASHEILSLIEKGGSKKKKKKLFFCCKFS